MLANLANIPETPEETNEWSFAHMAHHRDIIEFIRLQKSIVLPEYILDPMDTTDLGTFANQHQNMHNAFNSILGLAGNDLTDVNWQDRGQREAWIWLNFVEHQNASNSLGAV